MNENPWRQVLNSSSDKRKAAPQTPIQKRPRRRKWAGIFAIAFTLVFAGVEARAQQPANIPRIGMLIAASTSVYSARVEAFRQRLRELGYVEGKNIVIDYRYVEGKLERVSNLAAELVQLKVDVIVTTGPGILAAKKASPTMPIIFAASSDPVGSGVVSSLAQPGGNITGLSTMSPDLDGKRLELLKEAFPKVARVAFLWQMFNLSTSSTGNLRLTDMEAAAPAAEALGLKLLSLRVRSLDDFDSAFARAKKERAQALIATTGGLILSRQRQVLDFAAKNRLAAMYPTSEWVEAGGLMSYGPSYTDLWRRAADFVDKILKGTKPADIPVEQPTKFELFVNLKAAKQIGVTVPPNVLARADRVIK